jgi:Ca2+-binding RTX toxin-like protein
MKFGTGFESTGSKMTIDGSALDDADRLNLDFSGTDLNTEFLIGTGAAHGVIQLGPGNTTVATLDAGRMKIVGGAGNDDFSWSQTAQTSHTAFNVNSQYNGGAGTDSLTLEGDMSSGVVFGADTMRSIEQLNLLHGFSYDLTLKDKNIADTSHIKIDARAISGAGSFVHFDASHETGGNLNILGGGVTGVYAAGGGDDTIAAGLSSVMNIIRPGAGSDRVIGASQQDIVKMGAHFDASDHIDGVSGSNDEIDLGGDYSAAVHLSGGTIRNIDLLHLGAGHDYNLVFRDGNVASGKVLLIDGSALSAAHFLRMDGSHETDGMFDFRGGAGNDTLIGGASDDDFHGGRGADKITVGAGDDDLFYTAATDSTGKAHDIVTGFDVTGDFIGLTFGVFGQHSLTAGTLNKASFNDGLATVIDSSELNPNTAVSFTPDSGSLAGHHYLIIDANGTAGYQAGQDLVIEFVDPAHWGFGFNFFTGD